MYEVNVYTNRVGYKKQDAQEIMSFIDEIMSDLKFTRTMMQPIDNLSDATIYRMVARYEAKDAVGGGGTEKLAAYYSGVVQH